MNTDACKNFHKALAIIDETHSDRIVVGGTVTSKLHKVILNLHFPIFAKTLSTRCEASKTDPGVIEVDDEDYESLRAMLDFFWKLEYDVPETCTSEQAFDARLLKMADRCEVFSLGKHAHSRLAEMRSTAAWGTGDFV
ncbi:hypothetical protein DOTSEDRAFT_70936 [Dothistroma septosporum NZE10]|uniref:BTB domain-containing protein n=1 Tax=Dothistroma septosporum (strain NZE10 / CBS 128990) TaxID=675120 RepID=N1PQ58_DOTSN|nr:hypothetical protein DOTSEDRAFT_70936 [Dothistroma septosporum NZE10]